MGAIYFPAAFAHGSFAFNAHLNSDGTENQANVLATVRLDQIQENPGFRDLHDPLHLAQGGSLGRVHKGFKVWEATGAIVVPEGSNASRYALVDDKVRAMRAAFDPSICYRDSPTTDGAYLFTFTEATADTGTYATGRIPLQFWARPVGQPFIVDRLGARGSRPFRLDLLAPDPRTYEQTEQTLSTTTSGSVLNRGDSAAPLKAVITMNGAGSSTFTIARGGVSFILDLSGTSNLDVITVVFETCAPYGRGRYITKNGTENARLKTSAASTWLDVPVGSTTFTISNPTHVASCVLSWYSARS